MEETIVRKDGITYKRKKRIVKCNSYLNIRVESELLDKIKQIANKKGIKYNKLVKDVLKSYVETEV